MTVKREIEAKTIHITYGAGISQTKPMAEREANGYMMLMILAV